MTIHVLVGKPMLVEGMDVYTNQQNTIPARVHYYEENINEFLV
jgi:hypothetical protein